MSDIPEIVTQCTIQAFNILIDRHGLVPFVRMVGHPKAKAVMLADMQDSSLERSLMMGARLIQENADQIDEYVIVFESKADNGRGGYFNLINCIHGKPGQETDAKYVCPYVLAGQDDTDKDTLSPEIMRLDDVPNVKEFAG